jgi:hypothetical protein
MNILDLMFDVIVFSLMKAKMIRSCISKANFYFKNNKIYIYIYIYIYIQFSDINILIKFKKKKKRKKRRRRCFWCHFLKYIIYKSTVEPTCDLIDLMVNLHISCMEIDNKKNETKYF